VDAIIFGDFATRVNVKKILASVEKDGYRYWDFGAGPHCDKSRTS
jgi:hypothetical protein